MKELDWRNCCVEIWSQHRQFVTADVGPQPLHMGSEDCEQPEKNVACGLQSLNVCYFLIGLAKEVEG